MRRGASNWLVMLGSVTLLLASCSVYHEAPCMAPLCDEPAYDGASETISSPVPKSRPGIATSQGSTVSSKLKLADFKRTRKPKAVEVVYYNDAEGIAAVAGEGKRKQKALQQSKGGLIEWGLKSEGKWLTNYRAKQKRFVEGKSGKDYSIFVKNRCDVPLELVVSVDGLDVLSGNTASVKRRGVVVEPKKTLEIKGFQIADEKAARFLFSDVEGSYANALHGKTKNVGVIGIAIFHEANKKPWKWSPHLPADD